MSESSESKVKVTDKRMFTPEGELREDYRHLESTQPSVQSDVAAEPESVEPPPSSPPVSEPAPPTREAAPDSPIESPYGSEPGIAGEGGLPAAPTFLDLVGLVAEPIAMFLGDARLPDGKSAEDLNAARFYIDLLEVIKSKTAGNLTAEESALLEDLLYRLRLRYVQKKG